MAYETKHFSQTGDRLGCHCCGVGGASIALLILLEMVRAHFGKPIKINSCARCATNNLVVGGSKNSEHKSTPDDPFSDACDFVVEGVHESKVVAYLKSLPFANLLGIGKYKGRTHVDTRGYPARW